MRILVSLSDKNGIVDFINKLIIHYPELEIIFTSSMKYSNDRGPDW